MRNKSPSRRRLGFESLESRTMLTGTVTTAFTGSVLTLTGDGNANNVQVSENSSGTWTVTGTNTTIVGKTSFTGVTGLTTSLGAGDDSLRILNGTFTGTLQVNTLSGQNGSKYTQITNMNVGKAIVSNLSNGRNNIVINGLKTTSAGVSITTGSSDDSIMLSSINSATNLIVLAGDGNNNVSLASVVTHSTTLDNTITTGSGQDSIVVSSFTSASKLNVSAGGGTDALTLNSVNLGTKALAVDMGPGARDVLSILGSTAGTATLLDTNGTQGFLSGIGNSFTTLVIGGGFTNRFGDFA